MQARQFTRVKILYDIYHAQIMDGDITLTLRHEKHGPLTTESDLPASVYAFPKQRKEPLTDAEHVRNAVARFDQVIDVSDEDRDLAFANIEEAARHSGVGTMVSALWCRHSGVGTLMSAL